VITVIVLSFFCASNFMPLCKTLKHYVVQFLFKLNSCVEEDSTFRSKFFEILFSFLTSGVVTELVTSVLRMARVRSSRSISK